MLKNQNQRFLGGTGWKGTGEGRGTGQGEGWAGESEQ